MANLILSIFRLKTRTSLSIVIFVFLFTVLSLITSNYYKIIDKIIIIESKEENRRISILLDNRKLIESIKNLDYIESIEEKNIFEDEINLLVTVDNIKNIDNIGRKLNAMNLNYSVIENNDDELKTYQDLENFYKYFCIIFLILIFLIAIIQSILFVIWERNNLYFLKVLGYTTNIISLIQLSKFFIILFISMATTVFICEITNCNNISNISIIMISINILILLFQYSILKFKINRLIL